MRSVAYLAIAALMVAALVWHYRQSEQAPAIPALERRVKYSFVVENTGSRFLDRVDFWTWAPVNDASTQTVASVTASTGHGIQQGPHGLQKLHLSVDRLPPYGSRTVSVSVEMSSEITPVETEQPDIAHYLAPERYIEADDARIRKLADEWKGRSDWQTVENLYRWVIGHIQDDGYEPLDRGALYALEQKKGDCTESAYLFAALARAARIPARVMAGYVYRGNAVLKIKDYHNWAEVYIDDRWWVVDPDKERIREGAEDYIAMTIVGEGDESGQSAQRFFGTDAAVKIRMN